MAESITITDNRSGQSLEVPIHDAAVSSAEWAKVLHDVLFFDPGLRSTAVCRSSITYIDGEAGVLRYRGYPIEQLAERSTYLEVAYLLLFGELPSAAQLAEWNDRVGRHGSIDDDRYRHFLAGFPKDAHAMGTFVSSIAALSTFYPGAKDVTDEQERSEHVVRLIAKVPTLAAAAYRFRAGQPPVPPDGRLAFPVNFLSMMWGEAQPELARAIDVLFVLHADHEQNCSSTAMRVVGSSHADPYSACAAACAALYGPRHGGANEAVIRMLTEIGSYDNVDGFVAGVKAGRGRLQGFGHPVYRNYDPRARIIKQTADDVFAVTGKNPLLDIALKLEEVALEDEYFTSRQLYPNVDFYSGLIYQAIGFPVEMFPVLFAIPRTAGWLAQWMEMLDDDARIVRPRQVYDGHAERAYVPLEAR